MKSDTTPQRTLSMASTETAANQGPPAQPEELNENPLATTDTPPPPQKPMPIRSESRDVSTCSRNTRDSLRRNVSMRNNTFTDSERLFLEQLTIDGSDRDVEMALQTVEDEDLFFEHSTPRHLKHNHGECEPEIGLDINQSTSSGADDATRDGEAASVTTFERKGLDDKASSSPSRASNNTSTSHRASGSSSFNNNNNNNSPPVPSTILGSQKRREVLERRRSDSSLNMATLWRAHETGLAITSLGSQKSLLRRESSISSIGSNMSGLSVLFGNRPHPGASREDVFRYENNYNPAAKKESGGKSTSSKGKPPRHFPSPARRSSGSSPMMVRRSPHRRSKSATLFSPLKSLPKISEKALEKPDGHARAKSFGKRRSVTFNHIDEELEFDKDLESTAITPVDAVDTIPKRSQMVRRAVSDSQITLPVEQQEPAATDEEQQQQQQRQQSFSSIPSLHHGTPVRQDSIASIPSLHHGHALRGDSISVLGQSTTSIPSLHYGNALDDSMSVMGQSTSSIPSLHYGNPLRDDSMSVMGQSTSSIPSLHQGNPLVVLDSASRRDSAASLASVATFASLHPANPLRQDSVASFASLHPGNPIRQESMASTTPSLHYGRPIRQESMASTTPSIHYGRPIRQDSVASSIPPSPMTQNQMVQQFGVTEEIAAAWVELSSSKSTVDGGENRRSSVVSNITLPSLPDDIRVPDAATVPTISTAVDAGEKIPDGDTAPTVASTMDESDGVSLLTPMSRREAVSGLLSSKQKPVFFRQASQNAYEGEGVEVTELDDRPLDATLSDTDSYYYQHTPDTAVFRSMHQFQNYGSIRTAGSYDDVSIFSSFGQQPRNSEVFREIRRSLSDDNLSNFVGGQNKEFFLQIPNPTEGTTSETFDDEMSDDGCSAAWEMEFASPANGRFDAWNILQDEYANGYGGAGTLGFKILGTSGSDESAQPHVLSPPLMESLQAFLPTSKSGENFFMKYSMIRDGASLQTMLKRARGIQYSILAVETIDGEVFGSFTGQAWRKSWNYFGTGESFLWRMRHSRLEGTNGILDQAQKESEIDVYPYTGENEFIQLCTHDRIAVGGGIPEDDTLAEKKTQNEPSSSPLVDHDHDWGLGMALRSDLLQGSSSPCMTFGSPSLCKAGNRFEVVNVELWTMTPCSTQEEAENLELGKLFLGSAMSGRNSKLNDSLASSYTY
jgi:hypothetical protein